MSYVKWVANQDRHNDWTTEERLKDGTVVQMGVPLDLKAESRKEMEARGRVFEDSSAEEAKQEATEQKAAQPVGADVVGTAPVFTSRTSGDTTDQGDDAPKRS